MVCVRSSRPRFYNQSSIDSHVEKGDLVTSHHRPGRHGGRRARPEACTAEAAKRRRRVSARRLEPDEPRRAQTRRVQMPDAFQHPDWRWDHRLSRRAKRDSRASPSRRSRPECAAASSISPRCEHSRRLLKMMARDPNDFSAFAHWCSGSGAHRSAAGVDVGGRARRDGPRRRIVSRESKRLSGVQRLRRLPSRRCAVRT